MTRGPIVCMCPEDWPIEEWHRPGCIMFLAHDQDGILPDNGTIFKNRFLACRLCHVRLEKVEFYNDGGTGVRNFPCGHTIGIINMCPTWYGHGRGSCDCVNWFEDVPHKEELFVLPRSDIPVYATPRLRKQEQDGTATPAPQ